MDSKTLKKYDDWVTKHFEEIVEKYSRKTIIIYNDEILFVADTSKEAYQYVKEHFPGEKPLVFTVPDKEDFVCLL
ncbi:MAG: DUF5678 domain-containing protein [Bacteroidota bacterium]